MPQIDGLTVQVTADTAAYSRAMDEIARTTNATGRAINQSLETINRGVSNATGNLREFASSIENVAPLAEVVGVDTNVISTTVNDVRRLANEVEGLGQALESIDGREIDVLANEIEQTGAAIGNAYGGITGLVNGASNATRDFVGVTGEYVVAAQDALVGTQALQRSIDFLNDDYTSLGLTAAETVTQLVNTNTGISGGVLAIGSLALSISNLIDDYARLRRDQGLTFTSTNDLIEGTSNYIDELESVEDVLNAVDDATGALAATSASIRNEFDLTGLSVSSLRDNVEGLVESYNNLGEPGSAFRVDSSLQERSDALGPGRDTSIILLDIFSVVQTIAGLLGIYFARAFAFRFFPVTSARVGRRIADATNANLIGNLIRTIRGVFTDFGIALAAYFAANALAFRNLFSSISASFSNLGSRIIAGNVLGGIVNAIAAIGIHLRNLIPITRILVPRLVLISAGFTAFLATLGSGIITLGGLLIFATTFLNNLLTTFRMSRRFGRELLGIFTQTRFLATNIIRLFANILFGLVSFFGDFGRAFRRFFTEHEGLSTFFTLQRMRRRGREAGVPPRTPGATLLPVLSPEIGVNPRTIDPREFNPNAFNPRVSNPQFNFLPSFFHRARNVNSVFEEDQRFAAEGRDLERQISRVSTGIVAGFVLRLNTIFSSVFTGLRSFASVLAATAATITGLFLAGGLFDAGVTARRYGPDIGYGTALDIGGDIGRTNVIRNFTRATNSILGVIRSFIDFADTVQREVTQTPVDIFERVFGFEGILFQILYRGLYEGRYLEVLREWANDFALSFEAALDDAFGEGNRLSLGQLFGLSDESAQARQDFIDGLLQRRRLSEQQIQDQITARAAPAIPFDLNILDRNRATRSGNIIGGTAIPTPDEPLPGQLPQLRGSSRVLDIPTPSEPSFSDQLREFYDSVRVPGDLPSLQELRTNVGRANRFSDYLSEIESIFRGESLTQQDRNEDALDNFYNTTGLENVDEFIRERAQESQEALANARRLFDERNRLQEEEERSRQEELENRWRRHRQELRLRIQNNDLRRRELEEYQRHLQEIVQVPISLLTREQFNDRIEQTQPRFFEDLSGGLASVLSASLFSERFREESESWGEALARNIGQAFRNTLDNSLQNFLSEHLNRFFSSVFNDLIGGIFGTETTSGVARGALGGFLGRLFGNRNAPDAGGFVGPPRADGTFHEGGIIGGAGAPSGREVGIRALTGEAVLNQTQQDNLLFAVANGGGVGGGEAIVININNQMTGDVTDATMRAMRENNRELTALVGSELQRIGVIR